MSADDIKKLFYFDTVTIKREGLLQMHTEIFITKMIWHSGFTLQNKAGDRENSACGEGVRDD